MYIWSDLKKQLWTVRFRHANVIDIHTSHKTKHNPDMHQTSKRKKNTLISKELLDVDHLDPQKHPFKV